MVLIPGGTFHMGSNAGPPHEQPVHVVTVKAFQIDRYPVTVARFEQFVKATGYVTEAEKFGSSVVFNTTTGQWGPGLTEHVDWRHPTRPDVPSKPNEPVMQVSWNDAVAYAKWAGKRLPTEAEFEFAARGGMDGKTYAWGDELNPDGKYMANYWQGHFPEADRGLDGFRGVAPVGSFPANGYGLYDMTGNVWEWCADWYVDHYDPAPATDPHGPAVGSERVIRGGSWMCAENFCVNYRVSGRMHSTAETALNNTGFRCVKDVP
jgi:formylglycine-generating enzyme required for sulfatase activity